jgi:hypothetical protein
LADDESKAHELFSLLVAACENVFPHAGRKVSVKDVKDDDDDDEIDRGK